MKINFNTPVLNLDGEALKDEKGQEIIFSKQLGNALFHSQDKENPIRAYELAKKIYASKKEVDWDDSDVILIKEKIKSMGFTTGFMGPLLLMLEKK